MPLQINRQYKRKLSQDKGLLRQFDFDKLI